MRIRTILALVCVTMLAPGCVSLCDPLEVGMVVSLPIEDSAFIANAWSGLERAEDELGVTAELWENEVFEDFSPGVNHFIAEEFDMVMAVGFYGAETAQAAAQAHPDKTFVCVDHAYGGGLPNLAGADFDIRQATYLAGYLAAGMTKTGKVGVMGGMNIPPVLEFMQGFADGVAHYNEVKGTTVEVLGMETFLGSFDDVTLARTAAEAQLAQGADILMPAAGDAALGAAAAVLDVGNALFVGVDADMYLSCPDYGGVVLTSAMKNLDAAVYDLVKSVKDGVFDGTDYVGTLANGGVGLAPFHELDTDVPESLKQELEDLKARLAALK